MINDDWDPYGGEKREDEDDVVQKKIYKKGKMYIDEGFGRISIKDMVMFIDKKNVRDVVRDYCIQNGFSIVVDKANNKDWTVRCSEEGCGWRLHACRLSDGLTWTIKNPMVNTKWATRVLLEDIRAHNDVPTKTLNQHLWKRYGVQMAISTLYRMRSKALVEIHEGFDDSYSHLPQYCEVIKITNPGSIANCSWNSPQHPERPLAFTSIFISFRATMDGLFNGCRSLIGVDGCHLKGNYGGVLLSAIALDGNDELFPLPGPLSLQRMRKVGCSFTSLEESIATRRKRLWPEVCRRYCCKHLSVNFNKPFSGPKMWSLFWLACGAYSAFTFKKVMEAIN
ncbi:hypothetical protein RDABS01_029704 [Bienertia sinuspersici]